MTQMNIAADGDESHGNWQKNTNSKISNSGEGNHTSFDNFSGSASIHEHERKFNESIEISYLCLIYTKHIWT